MSVTLTRLGKVRGREDAYGHSFLGLRYGDPPAGARRFLPPIAASAWNGVHDATRYPNRAMQPDSPGIFKRDVPGECSEDCLFLNIYTPAPDNKARPVMVWIHGGAFVRGSANEYDGSVLAMQGDIVVVTVNFRLGVFGFFGLSDFGSEYAGSESNGVRDVVLALEWLRDNIADYGGDPGNVTISGESSGATMVMSLLAVPAADSLYHKAIGHSATCVFRGKTDRTEQLSDCIGVGPSQLFDRLKTKSANEIASINFPIGVYVDGDVITRSTMEAIRDRGASGVPLLIGSNLREGTLYTLGQHTDKAHYSRLNQALAKETLLGADPSTFLAALRSEFPTASPGTFHEMIWNNMFRRICLVAAETTSGAGCGAWFYRFDMPADLPGMEDLGAAHASELAFTFNIFEKPETHCLIFHDRNNCEVQRVASVWSDAIARFVATGNPNGGDLPYWPAYNNNDRSCLIIDKALRIESDPDEQMRSLWNS